ncbi:uncharacterized protein LOC105635929 [Jatropha curcas]|uniref:uncharacterized protein LOC105635929 n=1 Tax=Jatropha curcas TaxID=180498 RepID=UPI0018961EB8|nr:uncharacterized protein LOC105635929 [Jatropha curcas]
MTVLYQTTKVGRPLMNLVKFKGVSILEQLHLEEKLLRTSSDNWCIVNDGTNAPAIVMGLSGKPSELLEIGPVLRDHVPVIKRFTGGGTVIVDGGTIFVTLICNKDDVPGVQPYPPSIMSWSGLLYNEVFQGIGDFQLRENDYVFGDHKFGGNAQSIIKSRWVHHTSFLWDYDVKNMAYLRLPALAPKYRSARNHNEFLNYLAGKSMNSSVMGVFAKDQFSLREPKGLETHFSVKPKNSDAAFGTNTEDLVHTTRLLMKQELEDAQELLPGEQAQRWLVFGTKRNFNSGLQNGHMPGICQLPSVSL